MVKLHNGDCLEVMDRLIEEGVEVDAIITDLPYGTTVCKWDSVIPLNEMWERVNKLIRHNGNIIFFSQEPFTSNLVSSNYKQFKHKTIWQKTKPTGFPMANYRPLKSYEEIVLFSDAPCTYVKSGDDGTYNPQGLVEQRKEIKRRNSTELITSSSGGNLEKSYVSKYTNYPRDIVEFSNGKKKAIHPCEKPLDLMEYLVKTYTNEEDTILDFTMGSGSTGVVCKSINRKFIGIEMDESYFEIAKDRIKSTEIKGEIE